MTASLEDRLNELEVRFAFVEDTIGALNAAVAAHDRDLVELRQAFERLRGELATVRVALADDAREEPPPPHY
ncbi:MAG TPA: SlyX family protein [Dokdonella sp.]